MARKASKLSGNGNITCDPSGRSVTRRFVVCAIACSTGKSTLLRIINGEYQTESGEISKIKNLSIGFLNQDLLSYNSDESILEVAMQAFAPTLELEKEIHELLEKMEHDHSEEILHALHDKQVLLQ